MSASSKNEGTFGTRFAAARKAAKLSQDALAEKIGVSKPQISRYENGLDLPGYGKIPAIEAALGLSMAFLLTGDDSVGGKAIDPRSYELLVKLESLPKALQAFVRGALDLADETKGALPNGFLNEPTQENWADLSTYLVQLAELLRSKNKPPPQ